MNAAAATTSRHGKRDLTPDQIEGVPLAAATRATTTTNTSAERKDATIPPLDVDEGAYGIVGMPFPLDSLHPYW